MLDQIGLSCTQCHNRNYVTTVNKKNMSGKLERKKFCKHCRATTLHKEVK